ncbi:hypothetical protein ACFLX4_00265 [Chloroflexota bacterium]
MGLFDFTKRMRNPNNTTEIKNQVLQPQESAKLEQVTEKVFANLRSLRVGRALNSASQNRYPVDFDPSFTFLEGALAYAIKYDELALKRFRMCIKLKPLSVEAPYYVGQLLTESAIDDYMKSFQGPVTAEKALRWANKYDEVIAAFAFAEEVSGTLGLKSVQQHLHYYKMLLGVDLFSRATQTRFEIPAIDDRYTTPDKWLSLLGLQYNEQQVNRREELADLVSNLAIESGIVYVTGARDVLSPISILLSRRKRVRVFEVGPMMSDEMLKGRLTSISPGSVVLTDSRRIGFGGYLSWAPPGAEALDIVFVNPQHILSVELLGLLARLGLDAREAPTVRYTLTNFIKPT